MYRRILVPIDGSDTSNRGLEEAVRLAKEQGAALRLLHVIDEHLLTFDFVGFAYPANLVAVMRENGEKILDEAFERTEKAGVPAESVIRESGGRRISETVLAEARAWPADLIIMGTHGRRGISHLALGSDAEQVVRECPCPVLLVRAA